MENNTIDELREQLEHRFNPVSVSFDNNNTCLIIKANDREITIISEGFLEIKTISTGTEDVLEYLRRIGGGVSSFVILPPEKIEIKYSIL